MATKKNATPKDDVVVENLVVGAGANDTAIQKSEVEAVSEIKMDDSKESKDIIAEDKKIKDALVAGDITGLTASEMSIVMQPMVADLETGRPVYPTAEAAMLAQSLAGKLV